MGKAIKSMTLEEAKAYQSELKASGKTSSTSKEAGKVANYIKTLEPQNYGEKDVASAYKQLSSGVTQTGGWAEKNLDSIEQYTGSRPQLTSPSSFGSSTDVANYLDNYQSGIYDSKDSVALRDSIIKQLEPSTPKPEVLNRVEKYDEMRQQYGVADLEKNLTDLKTAMETEVATTRQRKQTAEGGQVAMGVIAGRVGEIERQQNERVDVIRRQIETATDQLNTAYNVISTYMNYMGLDYQDAVSAYNTEFNRNVDIYKMVDAAMDKKVANARANLQVYTNAIQNGNMSYASLSPEQKSTISKLEVQSGLPIGFIGSLKMSPKDRILGMSSDNTQAWILGDDGNMKVIQTGLSSNKGSGSSGFQSALENGRNDLEGGRSWGEVYNRIASAYPNAKPEEIDAGLGTEWRNPGAYENFKAKTGSTTVSASDKSDIQEVKTIIIQNGGSQEDLKRAETDADFRAWIRAKYI